MTVLLKSQNCNASLLQWFVRLHLDYFFIDVGVGGGGCNDHHSRHHHPKTPSTEPEARCRYYLGAEDHFDFPPRAALPRNCSSVAVPSDKCASLHSPLGYGATLRARPDRHHTTPPLPLQAANTTPRCTYTVYYTVHRCRQGRRGEKRSLCCNRPPISHSP